MKKLILIALILTSCTVLKTQSKKEFSAYSWEKASIDSVKASVLAEYDHWVANDSWMRMRPELKIPNTERSKLICHAFAYYVIDSLSLVKMNEKTDLSSVLKLNKDYMYCLFSMGNDFIFATLRHREIGKWKIYEYGLIPKDLSAIYDDFINIQKKRLIIINTELMDLDSFVYFEDGDYWTVSKTKLNFKKEILERFHSKGLI